MYMYVKSGLYMHIHLNLESFFRSILLPAAAGFFEAVKHGEKYLNKTNKLRKIIPNNPFIQLQYCAITIYMYMYLYKP